MNAATKASEHAEPREIEHEVVLTTGDVEEVERQITKNRAWSDVNMKDQGQVTTKKLLDFCGRRREYDLKELRMILEHECTAISDAPDEETFWKIFVQCVRSEYTPIASHLV